MSERNHASTIKVFVLGAAIGAAVGAGLGLLFAPQSGKETRKKVQRSLDDISETTGELIDGGKEEMEKLAHLYKKIVKQ